MDNIITDIHHFNDLFKELNMLNCSLTAKEKTPILFSHKNKALATILLYFNEYLETPSTLLDLLTMIQDIPPLTFSFELDSKEIILLVHLELLTGFDTFEFVYVFETIKN